MGNELFKKYTISKTPLMSTGLLSLWKVYQGYHKEKKQDVCIFYLDKKSLKSSHKSKSERREIISLLKKDASNLIKYQSDYFLKVIEPLIEDKTSMGFITEPFQSTLSKWCEQTSPSKLEIKLMIKEVCNGISQLHNQYSIVHCDINSNSIYITKANKIKISGLAFSQSEGKMTLNSKSHNNNNSNNSNVIITPNLNYASPEIILEHIVKYQSDTFSIGLLIYSLLKRYLNIKNRHLLNNPKDIAMYKAEINQNFDTSISKLDFIEEDNEFLFKVLNKDSLKRPSIEEMLSMPWFNDPKLLSLYFLDNLDSNDYDKNISFIDQLPNYITHYENRVIERRILPSLLRALNKENLMSVVLSCIFAICDLPMLKIKFKSIIWPQIRQLFQLKSLPASTLYTLLNKIEFFGNKLTDKEFNDCFLHVIYKALDSNVSKIQSIVVDHLTYVIGKFDLESFQSKLYTRLMSLLTSTTSNEIKAKILKCIREVYPRLDHNSINETLLSSLSMMKITESSYEVCIGIALLYEEIAKIVSIESIANMIIPRLVCILISGTITKNGFDSIMKSVLTYLDRIKSFREKDFIEEKSEPSIAVVNESRFGNSKIIMMETMNESNNNINTNFFADFFNRTNTIPNNSNGMKGDVEKSVKKLNTVENIKDFDLLAQNDLSFEEVIDNKDNKNNNNVIENNVLQFTEGNNNCEFKLNKDEDNFLTNKINENLFQHHSYNQDLFHIDDLNNILDHDSGNHSNDK